MSNDSEISDEELERRIRAKFFSGGEREAPRMSDEDQRMAERLVGRDNLQRIANARDGRRVRLSEVRVHYEWYWIDAGPGLMSSWRINRIENGRQSFYASGYDDEGLTTELFKLRNSGARTQPLEIGFVPRGKDRPKESAKKANLDRLRNFRW